SKERWLAPSRRESSWTCRGCCHCQAKKDQGQLAALAPHPPSGHLPPQAGEGLKLYRARRRGVLSLRQVSLHKHRKRARAVTARKLLILMSAKERRVKTRPTGLWRSGRRVKTRPTRLVAFAVALDFRLLTFGAPPERRGRRTRPAGRRTWMCGVFRAGRMPARKIQPAPRTRCVSTGRAGGVCFLCARFLCTSKERWLAPSPRECT